MVKMIKSMRNLMPFLLNSRYNYDTNECGIHIGQIPSILRHRRIRSLGDR